MTNSERIYFADIRDTWIQRPVFSAAVPTDQTISAPAGDQQAEKRPAGALGSIATNASPRPQQAENKPKSADLRDTATITRYWRQSAARRLLPLHRVSMCHRSTIPGAQSVEIHVNREKQSAHYRQLMTCDSVWVCPVCAAKLTEQRRQQLVILQAKAHELGFVPIMITYTMRHHLGERLQRLLDQFDAARRKHFKAGKGWQTISGRLGWVGSVRALEVTHGDNGWHVHAHELAFISPISATALKVAENDLKKRWIAALAKVGADASMTHGLDLVTGDEAVYEYVAKYGHEPKSVTWSIASEVTKSNAKNAREGFSPFQLLDLFAAGDHAAGELFKEYAAAFANQRQLHMTPGLLEKLSIDRDEFEQLLEAQHAAQLAAQLFAELSLPTWRAVLSLPQDMRGELLAVARRGDKLAFDQFLDNLLRGHHEREESTGEPLPSADAAAPAADEVERTDLKKSNQQLEQHDQEAQRSALCQTRGRSPDHDSRDVSRLHPDRPAPPD